MNPREGTPSGAPARLAPWVRARRRARGVATVEYTLILLLVVLPSIAGAILCYERVVGWYRGFVTQVSKSSP